MNIKLKIVLLIIFSFGGFNILAKEKNNNDNNWQAGEFAPFIEEELKDQDKNLDLEPISQEEIDSEESTWYAQYSFGIGISRDNEYQIPPADNYKQNNNYNLSSPLALSFNLFHEWFIWKTALILTPLNTSVKINNLYLNHLELNTSLGSYFSLELDELDLHLGISIYFKEQSFFNAVRTSTFHHLGPELFATLQEFWGISASLRVFYSLFYDAYRYDEGDMSINLKKIKARDFSVYLELYRLVTDHIFWSASITLKNLLFEKKNPIELIDKVDSWTLKEDDFKTIQRGNLILQVGTTF